MLKLWKSLSAVNLFTVIYLRALVSCAVDWQLNDILAWPTAFYTGTSCLRNMCSRGICNYTYPSITLHRYCKNANYRPGRTWGKAGRLLETGRLFSLSNNEARLHIATWTFRKNVNHCIYCWSKNNCNDKVLGASFHKCLSERSKLRYGMCRCEMSLFI